MSTIETTPLNLVDMLWRRPPVTMLDIITKQSKPFRLFVPASGAMPLIQSDTSAVFKTVRIDIVWKKVATSTEWVAMLHTMQEEPDGVTYTKEPGKKATSVPNGVFGVKVLLVVSEKYRVYARRMVRSLNPLEYTFDNQFPEDGDITEHDRIKDGVHVPRKQSWHVEVTLSDALRALIAEKADLVRVHLDGDKTRDVA